MKKCKGCSKTKLFSEFYKSKTHNDGHENKCKDCRNKQRRKHHSYICKNCKKSFNSTRFQQFCGNKCSGKTRRLTKNQFLQQINRRSDIKYLGGFVKSNSTVKLECQICGHLFQTTANNVINKNSGCAACAGILPYTQKEFEDIIYKLGQGNYQALGKYINSKVPVQLKSLSCGHNFYMNLSHFREGRRCTVCNKSYGELRIYEFLKHKKINFESEKTFSTCKLKKLLPFDFYIHHNNFKLLIEYDGEQHYHVKEFFGGEEEFKKQVVRDNYKNEWAKDNNIPLLRIPYWEFDRIEEILEEELKEVL